MGKALVIVESPAKAKIINGYLGDDYIVRASVGHIRDLPKSSKDSKGATSATPRKSRKTADEKRSALFERMGIDPLNNWQAHYEIMPDKKDVVKELKSIAEKCDSIYLATDLDREGEAIAWHLKEVLSSANAARKNTQEKQFWRVKYPEITRAAIQKAFANPGVINMDMVNAQQTRRFLDRVVGFMVSPLLWQKVGRGLSAGRVQSVAVELIVDREREIKAFIPQEYWTMSADTTTLSQEALLLDLATKGGKKVQIATSADAYAISSELQKSQFVVSKIESRKGTSHAPAPFTTSTLQQSANQRLGFSVKRTMTLAQRLYENGFITYMRTDSVNLSKEAVEAARNIINADYGPQYVPEKPNVFHSKSSAQEAHEAIRPSHPELKRLPANTERDLQRLYQLIYERYLACQMADQKYETRTIVVNAGDYGLRASGRTEIFDGYRAVLGNKSEDTILPEVKEGDVLTLGKINADRHFTQPPARYSEATLVKELEKDGIGRPSTYASIINTIQERGYVIIERNRFFATKMGEIVTDRLRHSFANLMDYHFTASMEESLDEIAEGKQNWIQNLNAFYQDFSEHLRKAELSPEEGGMPANRAIEVNLECPSCHHYNMAIQNSRTGTFLSCMGYHDPNVKAKDRCKCTLNLLPVTDNPIPEGQEMDEAMETDVLLKSKRCPKCGSTMDAFIIDRHHKLYICSNNPVCEGNIIEEGDFSTSKDLGPTVTCEKCGHDMVAKQSRFGKYMQCTNEACKNIRKILKNGEVAPPREDPVDLPELISDKYGPEVHYVLRDGANGLFLAAHNFPKVRETRPVTVGELKRFRNRLSPKFHYLADGPEFDAEGNPFVVRFSRKTKEQYLNSVKDDKPTTTVAFYNHESNTWQQSAMKKASRSKKADGEGSIKTTKAKSTKTKAVRKTTRKSSASS